MNDDFKFSMPAEISKGKNGAYKIYGLASTNKVDRQGEILDVSGFDLSHIDAGKGLINFDHSQKPEDMVGHIAGYSITPQGLFISGELFQGHRKAEDIWAVMQGLNKAGKAKWGLSVEGSVSERSKTNPKKILKAKIKNVAITMNPVNTDAWVDLAKSSAAVEEQEMLIKSLVGVETLDFEATNEPTMTPPTTFTAEQVLQLLQKALSVGSEAATTLPQNLTGGAALAKEDLEADPKAQPNDVEDAPQEEAPEVVEMPKEEPKKKLNLKKGDAQFYKALTMEMLLKLKTLYPEATSSELWHVVQERLNHKYLD